MRLSGRYSITYIDMNANAGRGKVVKKNQVLLPGNLTHPAACKHGNGRDWWVMIAERGKPIYHTWLITPAAFGEAIDFRFRDIPLPITNVRTLPHFPNFRLYD